MVCRRGLVGALVCWAASLPACAAGGGSLWSYSPGSGVNIEARCSSYLVALHPDGSKLLVTPYAGNLARPICESIKGPSPRRTPLVTGVAYEAGAQEYLAANRPTCHVVAGEVLTPIHSEFTFACPPAAKR